jgi:ubiquinone biosynthesis protein COQ9
MVEISQERKATQDAILAAFLQIAAFEGWNDTTLTKASMAAGQHSLAGARVFPEGALQAASYFNAMMHEQLAERAEAQNIAAMRVHERIHWLIMERLRLLEPHKEAVRRLMALSYLPWNIAWASRELWNICDVIWRLAGDHSTDMNYYSKRSLLAGVYKSTAIYWLQDDSEDYTDTVSFALRRIHEVLRVGKQMGNIQHYVSSRVESLADRIMYPHRTRTKRT